MDIDEEGEYDDDVQDVLPVSSRRMGLYLNQYDRCHYQRQADSLELDTAWIGLLDISIIVKFVQLWCRVNAWTRFPFCCISGSCGAPLQKITKWTKVDEKCHTCEKPEGFMLRHSNGLVDLANKRFNWIPDVFDRTNVLLHLILGNVNNAKTCLFMAFLCKTWLNNFFFCARC